MKFLVTNELKDNALLKLAVKLLSGVVALYLLLDVALFGYQIGLLPTQASETILGNEEAFIEPLLFDVLLAHIHLAIFTSMLTLVMLVVIYTRMKHTKTTLHIHTAFISALLSPVALLLGYFFGEVFIVLGIVCFVLWHVLALYFSLCILRHL